MDAYIYMHAHEPWQNPFRVAVPVLCRSWLVRRHLRDPCGGRVRKNFMHVVLSDRFFNLVSRHTMCLCLYVCTLTATVSCQFVAGAACLLTHSCTHELFFWLESYGATCCRSRPGAIIAGTWAGKMTRHKDRQTQILTSLNIALVHLCAVQVADVLLCYLGIQ